MVIDAERPVTFGVNRRLEELPVLPLDIDLESTSRPEALDTSLGPCRRQGGKEVENIRSVCQAVRRYDCNEVVWLLRVFLIWNESGRLDGIGFGINAAQVALQQHLGDRPAGAEVSVNLETAAVKEVGIGRPRHQVIVETERLVSIAQASPTSRAPGAFPPAPAVPHLEFGFAGLRQFGGRKRRKVASRMKGDEVGNMAMGRVIVFPIVRPLLYMSK